MFINNNKLNSGGTDFHQSSLENNELKANAGMANNIPEQRFINRGTPGQHQQTNPVNSVPSTPIKKKQTNTNMRIVMVMILFVAFVFVSMFPLYSVGNEKKIDIYASDLNRLSEYGRKLPVLAEGDIIARLEELLEEKLIENKDGLFATVLDELINYLGNAAQDVEAEAVYILNTVRKLSVLCIIASVCILIGIVVAIFAAVKDMKKLYFIACGSLLLLLIIASVLSVLYMETDFGIIGYGMWLAMATFGSGCLVSLKK